MSPARRAAERRPLEPQPQKPHSGESPSQSGGSPPQSGGMIDFGAPPPERDPAVDALLGQAERRQVESRLPRKQQEKKRREREKMRARREAHTTYDIPPELRRRIKELADELEIPASQLATLGLLRLLEALAAGELNLSDYKEASSSPRYSWNLRFDPAEFPATFAPKKKPSGSGRSRPSIK